MLVKNGLLSKAVSLVETLQDIVRNSPSFNCSKLFKIVKKNSKLFKTVQNCSTLFKLSFYKVSFKSMRMNVVDENSSKMMKNINQGLAAMLSISDQEEDHQ